MRKFFRSLGLRKPDEMEQQITARAQRNSYLFLVGALLLWSLYESLEVYTRRGRLNLLPCLLLVGAVLVQSFSQLRLTRRAVKDNEDSYETGPLVKIVVLACVLACAAAGIAAAVVLMGVHA